MRYEISLVIGSIVAFLLTIVMYRKVMPQKLNGTFQKPILQFLHNYFHFKKLYLEEILKFIFALASITCVVNGVLLLISVDKVYHYSKYRGSYYTNESTFLYGLALLIGGPIALRLAYEGIMMCILLVKNVMDINNKLKAPAAVAEEEPTEIPEEIPEV